MYWQIIYRFFRWLVLSIYKFRSLSITAPDEAQQSHEVVQFNTFKKAIHFNYKWSIAYFHKECYCLESPMFSNDKNNYGINWRLKIINTAYLKAKTKPDVDLPHIMYMKMCLVTSDVNIIQSICTVQLLSGIHNNTKIYKNLLQFTSEMSSLNQINKKKRPLLSPENVFLENGKIILNCSINAVIEIPIRRTVAEITLVENSEKFKTPGLTDFTFCVSGEEFHVNKAIVGAQSPVFNAMFNNKMEESIQNRVDITDVDSEVFGELLRFIYTGKVSNLKEYAIDLLPVADKYGLEKLIVCCAEELCTSVSSENAAEALLLANLHNIDKLKDVATAYIAIHAVDVIKTTGWNSLIRSYPDFVGEILCDISQQLQGVIS